MIPVLLAICSINYQQILLLDETIEICVIDGTTSFVGDERVLGTDRPSIERFSVIGEHMLKKLYRTSTPHSESAHVRDVK